MTLGKFSDYLELTKPRLTLMALVTTFTGYHLSAQGRVDAILLAATLVGAGLIGGAANAFNQCIETQEDSRMNRTRRRPLPEGRIPRIGAYAFAGALAAAGAAVLARGSTPWAACLGLATFALYVWVYTPLKKHSSLNTYVGAVAGALPTLIGSAAAAGRPTAEGWALFAVLFVWQLPHFFAIAWVYRQDYLDGGFRMIGAADPTGKRTTRSIFVTSLCLVAVSTLPSLVGATGPAYLAIALFYGSLLVGFAGHLAFNEPRHARAFILASVLYLLAINVSMISDKVS